MLDLSTAHAVAGAIRDMAVRGAPAIGCTAALGMALAYRDAASLEGSERRKQIAEAAAVLRDSRPTAVNLFWAVDRALTVGQAAERASKDAAQAVLSVALAMLDEDVRANREIGRLGAQLLPNGCTVLTHCNAGALATVGYGTALGVVRAAFEAGKLRSVYADETRPRLQGMLLTAWELRREGIPVTVLPDGAAAWLMRTQPIDCVVVGADRVATNGDVANKVGTYSLAISAKRHGVPFYVAAPVGTIDWSASSGADIPIEERSEDEVTSIGGRRLAPEGVPAWNPAFDVTPADLVAAIITEHGCVAASSDGIAGLRARLEGV